MKKLLFAFALVAIAILGSSCSKTKVCECTYTVNLLGSESSYTVEKTIESGSCSDLEKNAASWNVPGITEGSIHCTRK